MLASFASGSLIQIRKEFGSGVIASGRSDKTETPITPEGLRHLEDLSCLQEFASDPILVPDEVEPAFYFELREYVEVIGGGVAEGEWNELSITLARGVTQASFAEQLGSGPCCITKDITIQYQDQIIELGPFSYILDTVRVDESRLEETDKAWLVPAEDSHFTLRRGGPSQDGVA
jgi:hypothetical protein